MRVTIAQINPVVGDVEGNTSKMEEALSGCGASGTDLLVFPELSLVGYPPGDLLTRDWFIDLTEKALERILAFSTKYPEIGIIYGAPTREEGGKGLYNTALMVSNGRVLGMRHKTLLPSYDLFNEERYFQKGAEINPISFKGEKIGLLVGEDSWSDRRLWPDGKWAKRDPLAELEEEGVTILINISASPFYLGQDELRYELLRRHSVKYQKPFLYVNQIGANDELIFDGRSIAFNQKGEIIGICSPFEEQLLTVEMNRTGQTKRYQPGARMETLYQALVLGIRDYMRKIGFSRALVGLSGGIDSALTCCLAVGAVGRENVTGVSLPSLYSPPESVEDSRKLADHLGIEFIVIPITDLYGSYLNLLKPYFSGRPEDVTEENIQARIRGSILMAFSNKFGGLLLATGNKSELAMGYCTLYGDMSGGLSVLSDLPKTTVYELSSYINRETEIIPKETMIKAPSAELRPDQKDQDTLPPYPILDRILSLYIEEGHSPERIIKSGFEPETVYQVVNTIIRSEYKRRQAAPGLRVTTHPFGLGKKMPVAAKY